MIFRSQYGVFYQTFSSDGGNSWEPKSPTTIKAANAPAGILRLADGRLLLSWNDWGNYPGGRILRRGRQYLQFAISSALLPGTRSDRLRAMILRVTSVNGN